MDLPRLDSEVLVALQAEAGPMEPHFVSVVIGLFLKSAPKRLNAIAKAAACGDLEMVRYSAHNLKSAAGLLGARRLQNFCLQLEHGCRTGQAAGVRHTCVEMLREYQGLEEELRASLPPAPP